MSRIIQKNKKKVDPRYFLNEVGLDEDIIRIIESLIEEGIIDEGFMGDIAAKSSNALKALALAAAILAPTAGVSSAEAAPRAKVERMLVKGKMTKAQKRRLANSPRWLKMELRSLNDHLEAKVNNLDLERSTRDLALRVMGASEKDFPFGQVTTEQELKTFLLTGKGPGRKAKPAAKSKSFLDKVDDFASDVGQGMRKGLKYLDRESPIGANTGWFDDDKAPKR